MSDVICKNCGHLLYRVKIAYSPISKSEDVRYAHFTRYYHPSGYGFHYGYDATIRCHAPMCKCTEPQPLMKEEMS